MNKNSKNQVGAMLAAMCSIGILHSNANAFEIKNAETRKAAVTVLVENGLITPLEKANWYQINRERLEDVMSQANAVAPSAIGLIEMLKAVAGSDVNIRSVDIFFAKVGTQDYSSGQ